MTIRIKLRGDKAIVRFNNKNDEGYFIHILQKAKYDMSHQHPKISLKDRNGDELQPPKPPTPLKPVNQQVKLVTDVKPMEIKK